MIFCSGGYAGPAENSSMSITSILNDLRQRNIMIRVKGNDLSIVAEKGALSPETRTILASHKQAIVNYLRQLEQNGDREIQVVDRSLRLPLSSGQQRLWFLAQLEPASSAYVIPAAVRIYGSLQPFLLHQALCKIVDRHEVLRTVFKIEGGEPVQVILNEMAVPFSLIDLRHDSPANQETQMEERIRCEMSKPFDLSEGPLLRAVLLQLGEQEHVLFLAIHHIVADGWSIPILVRELSAFYAASQNGKPAGLPALPVQYADFAAWQHRWIGSAMRGRQLAYWESQLADLVPLALPTDHSRNEQSSPRGATAAFMVPDALASRLKFLGLQEEATPFVVFLAAFKVLLSRYSSQSQIAVGTPIANRELREIQGLIGFFVNTLVLFTHANLSASFRDLLRQVRKTMIDAMENQDLPFEQLVDHLQPERMLNQNPLFQVMFILENPPRSDTLGDLTLRTLEVEALTAKFDLTLSLVTEEGQLQGRLNYNRELFEPAAIHRMIAHYQALLEGVAQQPDQSMIELQWLTEAERQQLLVEWNKTAVEYPEETLVDLFERQADSAPEVVALRYMDQQLTYAELNERANQLAHYLRELGVQPEMPVAICLERSLEMVVALLGVLKAGGAYVPMDPGYPQERLRWMLEDIQPAVLLTQSSLEMLLPPFRGKIIRLDEEWEEISRRSSENPACEVSENNLAYVLYTSGSTGRPKSVGVHHSSVAVLMHWARKVFSAEELSGVLASTSICFDLSVFEIFAPLSWGGKVIVAGNVLELATISAREQVKLVNTVPSAMQELVRSHGLPQSVITVNLAGEALATTLVQHVYGIENIKRVLNLYGPSEDTTYSTWFWIKKEEAESVERPTVSIGTPISNTQVYVVDERIAPVPIGVAGELYIGGAGLARGYLNRPELTAERFVPNPFVDQGVASGWRLYRTGDKARWRQDGKLEYLGRFDDQVKIRGYRIELGEIEAVLGQHPSVAQSAVIVRGEQQAERRLVGYVVRNKNDIEGGSRTLREYLRSRLPEYMVPGAIMELEYLPLTPNGKLDRRALARMAPEGQNGEKAYVAPRTPREEMLTNIWAELLRVEKVGIHDSFFELGGHSLLALQLTSRIKLAFAVDMPVSALFKAPTVARMAGHIESVIGQNLPQASAILVDIQPHGTLAPFVCVHPIGGQVICYTELAKHLGSNQPFYGLQSPPVSESAGTTMSIEEMAQMYCKEILRVQSEGPYLLGGWSMGGWIAFEMARQLKLSGKAVGLLALFDTYPPANPDARANVHEEDKLSMFASFAFDLSRSLGKDWTAQAEEFLRSEPRQQRKLLLETMIKDGLLPTDGAEAALESLLNVFARNSFARDNYSVSAQRQSTILFQAADNDAEPGYNPEEWAALTGGSLEVHTIPGDHYTLLRDPGVSMIAQVLRQRIAQVSEDSMAISGSYQEYTITAGGQTQSQSAAGARETLIVL